MKDLRVLVVGGSGLIGSELVRKFVESDAQVAFTYNSSSAGIPGATAIKMNSIYMKEVNDAIDTFNPDIVIQASAIASVDVCENEKELCRSVNFIGTKNIVNVCKKSGTKIVYISTAAVFDGTKTGYEADDATLAVNYYGETKIEGEEYVAKSGLPFLIVRTDMPYGWTRTEKKDNIVLSLLDKFRKGNEVKEIDDRFVNPTHMGNFAEVLLALIRKNANGFYNIAGKDYLSRYEFAQRVAEVFEISDAKVRSVNFSDTDSKVPRANVKLISRKAERDSGITILGVDEGLARMKEEKA